MAAQFQTLSSYQTVQVLSANTVRNVQYTGNESLPTGIGYAYAIPLEVWKRNRGGDALGLIAGQLEYLAEHQHVVDGDAEQSIDASGLLADAVALVVEYDRSATGLPPLQGTVTIPVGDILLEASDPNIFNASGKPSAESLCQAEYDRLQALAAG
jgi:hypothetical protein